MGKKEEMASGGYQLGMDWNAALPEVLEGAMPRAVRDEGFIGAGEEVDGFGGGKLGDRVCWWISCQENEPVVWARIRSVDAGGTKGTRGEADEGGWADWVSSVLGRRCKTLG